MSGGPSFAPRSWLRRNAVAWVVAAGVFALHGCGGDGKAGPAAGGKGGDAGGAGAPAGTGGEAGAGGASGRGGATGGTAAGGTTGQGGSAGAGGSGGSAGTAGAAGSGGSNAGAGAGGAAQAGAGGTAGAAGAAGAAGGASGGAAGGVGGAAGGVGGAAGWLGCDATPAPLPMMLAPCLSQTDLAVCKTVTNACPADNTGDPLKGAVLTDKSAHFCYGPLGGIITVQMHVQGEVESKTYTGGTDQDGSAPSPRADGFYVGGKPSGLDAHNVYLIRVSYPGDPDQDYFLNSLAPPGVNGPAYTTYGIDYFARITVKSGGTIRLVVSDPNCSMTRNCGPLDDTQGQCEQPIVPANIEAETRARNPTFNFDAPYNGQWIALTMRSLVTQ